MERIVQYKGPRYVPKLYSGADGTAAWEANKPYEALTIVTYYGNSYTSRKPVPSGIDILNNDYWVATGNYNAQVESYRQIAEEIKDDLAIYKGMAQAFHVIENTNAVSINIEMEQNKNKTLVFKNKVYEISSGLVVPEKARVYLNGAVIKRVANVFEMVTMQSGAEIYGGVIDGASDGVLSNINPQDRFSNIHVEDCTDIYIHDITLLGGCSGEINTEGTHSTLSILNSDNVRVENCNFLKSYGTGLIVYESEHITVTGCRFKLLAGSGLTSYHMSNSIVSDCYADDCGKDYSAEGVYTNKYTGISLNGNDIVCSNCTSANNSGAGFTLGHDISAQRISLVGCVTYNNGLYGIYVSGTGMVISNCTSKTDTERAIYVHDGAEVSISNYDASNTKGIYVYKAKAYISNYNSKDNESDLLAGTDSVVLMINSYMYDSTASIRFITADTGATLSVMNCHLIAADQKDVGILLAANTNGYIMDCVFSDNITTPVKEVSAGTGIKLYRHQSGNIA